MRDVTIAQEIRDAASLFKEGDESRKTLERLADRLDAAAALIVTADPDQTETVAIALGDPEMNAVVEAHVSRGTFDHLAADYGLCHCRTLPESERLTGHHPDCTFWNAHAGAL